MKFFVFAVCVVMATAIDLEWEAFKVRFGKQYTDTEEITRYNIFKNNSHFVKQHNEEAAMGKHTYFMKMNEFGDLTDEEFRTLRLGKLKTNETLRAGERVSSSTKTAVRGLASPEVDWRRQGAVTNVKNQATCESGWAFSAAGALEGQHFLATGELVSLSAQNLVECSWSEGNNGCGGGRPHKAFRYIETNGGIDTEECYPYTATDEGSCKFNPNCIGATLSSYNFIRSGDEAALKEAVFVVGPISVSIHATMVFRFYERGVLDDPFCSSRMLDHAVLVVGYGTSDENQDYWLVKNSWGTEWGMEGYIMMSRNKNNQCGIATEASYPVMDGRDWIIYH